MTERVLDIGPHKKLVVLTDSVRVGTQKCSDLGLRPNEVYFVMTERHLRGLRDFYFITATKKDDFAIVVLAGYARECGGIQVPLGELEPHLSDRST